MSTTHASDLIAFGAWAQALGRTPQPDEIRARFPHINRATAYRWRSHLLAAWGIEPTGAYLRTHPAPQLGGTRQ